MVGSTRGVRSPAIAVAMAIAAISVAAAAVFDSDGCSGTPVGVGVDSGAVATGSEVGVVATAVEVVVADGLSLSTASFDDKSVQPIITSAIRALSSGNIINRR